MKNLRKRSMALALAAAGVGGVGLMSTQAVAVQLAADGLGEAAIFPYYTSNEGFQTLVHLINTSNTKAVAYKIRMRDVLNSRDCRDFNVVLSPNDVWTASIEENPATGFPRIWTKDNSCTSPRLPDSDRGGRAIDFVTADFTGGRDEPGDNNNVSIDRCREGYIEIVQMGVSDDVPGTSIIGNNPSYYDAALHDDATGIPAKCSMIESDFANAGSLAAINAEFTEPENVLAGNFTILRTKTGQAFGGEPTMLANFINPLGTDGASAQSFISTAGDDNPSLNSAFPPVSVVTDIKTTGNVFVSGWARGVDAVSAVLQRSSVINEWSTNSLLGVNTDWIVTFPTKRFYADSAVFGIDKNAINSNGQQVIGGNTFPAPRPFTRYFYDDSACENIGIKNWDREEKTTVAGGFSPQETPETQLCHEVNVITYNRPAGEKGVFGSNFSSNINPNLGSFGWTRLDLTNGGANPGMMSGPLNYAGLPVTGFAVFNRNQGLNYGSLFDHKYERDIKS